MRKEIKLDIICCPECHSRLETKRGNKLFCPQCQKNFLIKDNIPSFINQGDNFYEGRFMDILEGEEKFTNPVLKKLYNFYTLIAITHSRERFLKKILKGKNNLLVLDLGCGGGRKYLTQFGRVVGIDISLQSLKKAKKVYDMVVQADILKLPFHNETFDLVVSTDVIGHIPIKNKDKLISEIYRVTKKGGYSAHSIECDSESLIYRWAKSFPDLYQKYFIEMYGHCGLELPGKVFERFRRVGFSPIIEKADPCKGYLRPIESYVVFFNNEYKEKSLLIKILVTFCKLIAKKRLIRYLFNFILGLFIPLADLITPLNHRDSVKVYYLKTIS